MMKQIGSIQILRAIAAMMVVLAHAQDDALNQALKAGTAFAQTHALPWDAGVDLFFVISGFIMVHASQRLFATPGASSAFISRRLIRIVPLYWIITTIALAILALVAWRGKQIFPSLSEILASFGFMPFARPEDGQPRPIAAQGWTLNYEMFFYIVFAIFVRFRRETAVAGVTLTLAIIVGLGLILRPAQTTLAYWSDPIVLEFAIGMGIALAWRHGLRLPRRLVIPLVIIGIGVLALDLAKMEEVANFGVKPNGFARLAACGLPMALVFGTIVLAEPALSTTSRFSSFLCLMGDSSYALYLFHPLVIVAARKAYLASGLASWSFWPLVLADIPLAALLALLVHRMIEMPVTTWLQTWIGARRIVVPAPSRSIPSTVGR